MKLTGKKYFNTNFSLFLEQLFVPEICKNNTDAFPAAQNSVITIFVLNIHLESFIDVRLVGASLRALVQLL